MPPPEKSDRIPEDEEGTVKQNVGKIPRITGEQIIEVLQLNGEATGLEPYQQAIRELIVIMLTGKRIRDWNGFRNRNIREAAEQLACGALDLPYEHADRTARGTLKKAQDFRERAKRYEEDALDLHKEEVGKFFEEIYVAYSRISYSAFKSRFAAACRENDWRLEQFDGCPEIIIVTKFIGQEVTHVFKNPFFVEKS